MFHAVSFTTHSLLLLPAKTSYLACCPPSIVHPIAPVYDPLVSYSGKLTAETPRKTKTACSASSKPEGTVHTATRMYPVSNCFSAPRRLGVENPLIFSASLRSDAHEIRSLCPKIVRRPMPLSIDTRLGPYERLRAPRMTRSFLPTGGGWRMCHGNQERMKCMWCPSMPRISSASRRAPTPPDAASG